MPEFAALYAWLGLLPIDCLQLGFMQRAMMGLLLLAPMSAVMGLVVVNFRMAFFADAISHSAFAGVALGLIFALDPDWTMPLFGLAVGLGIVILQKHSNLSNDTVIGVFFSGMVAFGLAIISRERAMVRDLQRFLYGDILTINDGQILGLIALFGVLMTFQYFSYNRLLYIGFNPGLARAHRIAVNLHQYIFAALLSLLVMFSVQSLGVLLVTALLIVPAAAARNLAVSAGGMFWWTLLISISSAVSGLLLSAQEWARTATGATIILVACLWFLASLPLAMLKKRRSLP